MKIGSPEPLAAVGNLTSDRSATGSAKKTSSTAPGSDSTSVALSSTAVQMRDASSMDGPFDAEKVQRIAQAIRDGQFRVNPEKIADKLIANAQELLNGKAS